MSELSSSKLLGILLHRILWLVSSTHPEEVAMHPNFCNLPTSAAK